MPGCSVTDCLQYEQEQVCERPCAKEANVIGNREMVSEFKYGEGLISVGALKQEITLFDGDVSHI